MASASESCLYITVDEDEIRDDTSYPGIIAGGIAGLIVGLIVGFILYVLCCSRKRSINKTSVVVTDDKEKNVTENGFLSNGHPALRIDDEKSRIKSQHRILDEDEETPNTKALLEFSEFLSDATWAGMILQLGKRRLSEMILLQLSFWEERHVCLLQQFRCILNDLMSRSAISEPQSHDILACKEKELSESYRNMKDSFEVYSKECLGFEEQSLLEFFAYIQESYATTTRSMISQYRGRVYHFSDVISKIVQNDNTSGHYRDALLHHLDMVEGFYRKNHDEVIESSSLIYKRVELIVRNLAIFLISENETVKFLISCYNSSLEKLVRTGRISSTMREQIRESLQFEFPIEREDLLNALSTVNPSLVAQYSADMMKHEKQYNENLVSILHAYDNQVSSDGFVESYLTACCEKKLQLMAISKEFADHAYTEILMNIANLSRVQKTKRADAIREFCQRLEEVDALSGSEVRHLEQDFVKKLDVTQAKFMNICQRNTDELWRQNDDRMITHLQEESQVDAAILQDSVSDNLISLENLLQLQINLTETDYQAVLHDRESLLLLIVNEINSFRTQWLHTVENDVATFLAKLLFKMSKDVASNTVAEISGVLDYLWNERGPMNKFSHEKVSVSCINLMIDVSRDTMSMAVSKRLLKNLMSEETMVENEKRFIAEVERNLAREISTKDKISHIGSATQDHNETVHQRIKDQTDNYSAGLSMVEQKTRASQTKRLGRLNTKAQKISQHRPPSGSNPNDLQPYLEQILLQSQVSRALENVESEGVRQILLERLRLDGSALKEIAEVSADSIIRLLVNFSVLAGLSKNDFTACMTHAKKSLFIPGPIQKGVIQRFNKHWKIVYNKRIPY